MAEIGKEGPLLAAKISPGGGGGDFGKGIKIFVCKGQWGNSSHQCIFNGSYT